MFGLEMFGVEIDKAQLLGIGLNAIGYLAAGGLSVMLYSAMTKRRWRMMFSEIIEQSAKIVAINNANNAAEEVRSAEEAVSHTDLQDSSIGSESGGGFLSFGAAEGARPRDESAVQRGQVRQNIESAVTQYRRSQGSIMDGGSPGVYTQNRTDVIRLAKEMLASGRSSEHVRNKLPITDSELRLVELGAGR